MQTAQYEVLTWDTDASRFTPQEGVEPIRTGKWDLRRALRELQACGYSCHSRHDRYDTDFSVSVARM